MRDSFPSSPTAEQTQRIWVIFTDNNDLKSMRFLKRGFRHCYVLLHDGYHWISMDPLAHMMEIAVHRLPPNFDLPDWLSRQDQIVLPVQKEPAPLKPAPIMAFTCVESVKRALGIHKRGIFTPWQLYSYLNKKKDKDKDKEQDKEQEKKGNMS